MLQRVHKMAVAHSRLSAEIEAAQTHGPWNSKLDADGAVLKSREKPSSAYRMHALLPVRYLEAVRRPTCTWSRRGSTLATSLKGAAMQKVCD